MYTDVNNLVVIVELEVVQSLWS